MAKDLELEKSSPESEEAKDKLSKDDDKSKKTEKAGKGAKTDKADKKDKDKKAAAKGKKPKKGPIKYLKDAKSEFKKVVWPTPKETTRNTIIVVCLLAGLFVFGLDSLFGLLNNLLFK